MAGGHWRIISAPSAGTRILIDLPVADEQMNSPIRVLLIDDHTVMRSGLRLLIEQAPDITVTGEAATGLDGVELALLCAPM